MSNLFDNVIDDEVLDALSIEQLKVLAKLLEQVKS
jgi:hypothetical protein